MIFTIQINAKDKRKPKKTTTTKQNNITKENKKKNPNGEFWTRAACVVIDFTLDDQILSTIF